MHSMARQQSLTQFGIQNDSKLSVHGNKVSVKNEPVGKPPVKRVYAERDLSSLIDSFVKTEHSMKFKLDDESLFGYKSIDGSAEKEKVKKKINE